MFINRSKVVTIRLIRSTLIEWTVDVVVFGMDETSDNKIGLMAMLPQ
jgi:hypothetical protein